VNDQTIATYNLAERVASYDADMRIMHPNRSKMAEIALETLPLSRQASFLALDLGTGTGYFAQVFLARYAHCRVLALDGAPAMIQLAHARLDKFAGQVEFILGDFRNLDQLLGGRKGRLVFTSFALHHLNRPEKVEVVRKALSFLEPGGWFLNADLIKAESEVLERRIQELRVDGIVRRASGSDPRFADPPATRKFLDELETNDNDQPLTLAEDLQVLKEAGLIHSGVLWLEYREAVTCGMKP
jgi:tRNA (cmo5U34)-methyltransferase